MLFNNLLISNNIKLIFLKKIILFFLKKLVLKNKILKNIFLKLTNLSIDIYSFKSLRINFFFKYYSTRFNLLTDFLFCKRHKLVINISFTKHNFFFSISPNFNWILSSSKKKTSVYSRHMFKTSNFNSTSFSLGEFSNIRKQRFLWENYDFGKQLSILVLSTFWSLIIYFSSKQFSIIIRLKNSIKIIRPIMFSLRKHFNQLHSEHYKYVRKRLKESRFLPNELLLKDLNYTHSLSRLEIISRCPLKIDSIQSIKKTPHNGCKLKKLNVKRKRRNR